MSKIKLKFLQYSAVKATGLTVLYFIILIALYLIYGSGDTHNNFIYNEF
ncbi:teichoic acid D-Ala incorporation-associated protein DltX [Staphylococcus kloosii]|nr:teichoic acid D-Ala incorporation-associated protein DltX [Staphylococcus kloosii]MDT3960318.1 teichoic acid D-Ala incorporation-associated protein DltX [Staphylococcus kloosii]